MKKQITKNQHYVPQLLLNNFSYSSKKGKRINIFDVASLNIRFNQSVKEVFSQNYFYDRDNKTEDFISDYLETPASPIIEKIIDGHFKINEEELNILYAFILSLYSRTPEATKKADKFLNSHLESVIGELLELNGFDPEEAKRGKFEFKQDNLASLLTAQGTVDSVILRDLAYCIIKNETQLEFFISDHPVFVYNWLYRDLEHPGITSLCALGLQLFLPLSPKIILCLYDPKIYKYGSKDLVFYAHKENDIDILNSFQIINSSSFIGFSSKKSEDYLKKHTINTKKSSYTNIEAEFHQVRR